MAKKTATAAAIEEPQGAVDTLLQGKFRTIRDEINAALIERRDEILLSLAALISGKHAMFVGPPGTAKSLLAHLLGQAMNGKVFDFQFNKYTGPEEVFGPLDIPSLKGTTTADGKSAYLRVTTDYLPEAHVAHLDELGKASTAISNTLLRILNEGTMMNAGQVVKCPLLVAIASSNEWIGDGETKELGALFDRFAIRKAIRQIATPAGRKRLLYDDSVGKVNFSVRLAPQEVLQARTEASALPFTAHAIDVLEEILAELHKEGIAIGDRRQKWAVSVARAGAYLAGNAAVEAEDLEILQHVLWSEPMEQPAKAAVIVMKKANPTAAQVTNMLGQAQEIVSNTNTKDLPSVIEATKKLADIKKKLAAMKDSERRDAALEFVTDNDRNLRKIAMDGV
jgi:MoxR-like ATPase